MRKSLVFLSLVLGVAILGPADVSTAFTSASATFAVR